MFYMEGRKCLGAEVIMNEDTSCRFNSHLLFLKIRLECTKLARLDMFIMVRGNY